MSDVTGAEAVTGAPARELIESGFALENADAPLLHHGLNLADIAHEAVQLSRPRWQGEAQRQRVTSVAAQRRDPRRPRALVQGVERDHPARAVGPA